MKTRQIAVLLLLLLLLVGMGVYFALPGREESKATGAQTMTSTIPATAPQAAAAQGAATQGAAVQSAVPSDVAEKDGLAVVIEAVRATIFPGQNLELHVTYRNASKEAYRFPSGGSGQSSILYILEDVSTGKTFTGGGQAGNGAPRLRGPTGRQPKPTDPPLFGPTPALKPGEARVVEISPLQSSAFYAGKWDDFASYSVDSVTLSRGPPGEPRLDGGYAIQYAPGTINTAPKQIPIPPGTYKVSVIVEFPAGDQAGAGVDPTPLWKGLSIRSNPVVVTIEGVAADYVSIAAGHGLAAANTGWIRGAALDTEGKPAAKTGVFYYLVMDLKTVPQLMPAGTTDEAGHFVIQNLPPGRYMVVVGNPMMPGVWTNVGDPPHVTGSVQPVEVRDGMEARLKEAVRMVLPRGGVGGG